MTDAVTTVKGCWASCLGDCDGKISREHIISACLFASGNVTVKGFDWCKDEQKTIGVDGLVRKILCKRHNSELSRLDFEMLKYFNALRESARLNKVRTELRQRHWTPKRFEVDGKLLERWFLKTLINLSFKGLSKFGDYGEVPGMPTDALVETAFGRRPFEEHAGMYLCSTPGETITMLEGVSIRPMTEENRLSAGEFIVCGYRFILSLVSEEVNEFDGSQLMRMLSTCLSECLMTKEGWCALTSSTSKGSASGPCERRWRLTKVTAPWRRSEPS